MATLFTSRHCIASFGSEVIRRLPHQADLIIISGTVFPKNGAMVMRLYYQLVNRFGSYP
jgi:NADH-quinone oxidoreductase subunit B